MGTVAIFSDKPTDDLILLERERLAALVDFQAASFSPVQAAQVIADRKSRYVEQENE
jgi:hypothetical protein